MRVTVIWAIIIVAVIVDVFMSAAKGLWLLIIPEVVWLENERQNRIARRTWHLTEEDYDRLLSDGS